MTENEEIKKVINGLIFLKEKLYNGIYSDRLDCIDYAISALKEVQKYREIGTVEECRTAMDYWKYLRERRCGLDAVVEKCMEYEKIGTVEECREAVEKQKVFCESAEKYADGNCIGYGKSEMDDEPIEMCKRCKSYVGFEESEGE